MPTRDPIRTHIESKNGWKVEDLNIILQRDDYQCGIWVHALSHLFHEYVTEEATGGFGKWLWEWPRRFASLTKLKPGSRARNEQGDANDAFITQLRGRMRDVLQKAHEDGVMPWEVAQLEGFADNPATSEALDRIDLCDDDGDEDHV